MDSVLFSDNPQTNVWRNEYRSLFAKLKFAHVSLTFVLYFLLISLHFVSTTAVTCQTTCVEWREAAALTTRLHQFARSLLYNATAGGALW